MELQERFSKDTGPSLCRGAEYCYNFSVMIETPPNFDKLECGPMPNVMTALPNIGGALCSTPQILAGAHY